jgi:hypothetical protein
MKYSRSLAVALAVVTYPIDIISAASLDEAKEGYYKENISSNAQQSSVNINQKYDPNCPKDYIKVAEKTIKYENVQFGVVQETVKELDSALVDIFVVRVPMSPRRALMAGRGMVVNEPNSAELFKSYLSSGKPNLTCRFTVGSMPKPSGYSPSQAKQPTCQNNYTGLPYNPKVGIGIEIDRNGNQVEEECSSGESCLILEDKAGGKFIYRYNAYSIWVLPDERGDEVHLEDDGTWKGAMVEYGGKLWRTYNGNDDLIVYRKIQYGFFCDYTPPPNYNF